MYGKRSHTLTVTYLKWSWVWYEIQHPDSNLLEVISHLVRNPTPWQQLIWSDSRTARNPTPWQQLTWSDLHLVRNPTPWQQLTWSDLVYGKKSHTLTATYLKWSCIWYKIQHPDSNLLEVISRLVWNPTPWQQFTWSDLTYGKKSHTLTATYLKWSCVWYEIQHHDSNLLEVISHLVRNPTAWQ